MSDRITTSKLEAMKTAGEKFVMVTAYDATFARLVSDAGAECILVGDSLGMVLQGHDTTVPVSLDAMVYHTECVARARPRSMIVSDLPFMTYSSPDVALAASMELMQKGAQMVKLEGGTWLSETIHQLVQRGIPVCAHLGLTPQSVNVFGGYRVMGRTPKEAKSILADAVEIQDAGASILLLECVPEELAADMSVTIEVEVTLAGGQQLTGTLVYLQPIGQQRLQDHLNTVSAFIAIRDGNSAHVINTEAIVFIRTLVSGIV